MHRDGKKGMHLFVGVRERFRLAGRIEYRKGQAVDSR